MQEHRYRRIYISDELERLHSEFIWQLCDADAHRVVDLGNHFVFVNLHRGPRVGVTVISPTLGEHGPPQHPPSHRPDRWGESRTRRTLAGAAYTQP